MNLTQVLYKGQGAWTECLVLVVRESSPDVPNQPTRSTEDYGVVWPVCGLCVSTTCDGTVFLEWYSTAQRPTKGMSLQLPSHKKHKLHRLVK